MNVSNGLVPLATPQVSRLASDVARFLLGMPAPRRRLSLRSFYARLNVGLVILSAYQIWSLVRLLRPSGSAARHWGRSALGVAALCEVGLAAVGLRVIPRLADSPWSLLKVYVPDIVSWLTIFASTSLVKCLVVLGRLVLRWTGSPPRK